MEDSTTRHPGRGARLQDPQTVTAGSSGTSSKRASRGEPLSVCVERALEAYFADLDGEPTSELYALVLAEVEAPLLATVMRRVNNNQSVAAKTLGLNRGTLRKKLKQYGLL